MAKIVHNNARNTKICLTLFELNNGYYFNMFCRKNIVFCFCSKTADKLAIKFEKLLVICDKNFHYA